MNNYWCVVDPSGIHRYQEESRIVYVLHPKCKHCGYINTDIDLEKVREGERNAKSEAL